MDTLEPTHPPHPIPPKARGPRAGRVPRLTRKARRSRTVGGALPLLYQRARGGGRQVALAEVKDARGLYPEAVALYCEAVAEHAGSMPRPAIEGLRYRRDLALLRELRREGGAGEEACRALADSLARCNEVFSSFFLRLPHLVVVIIERFFLSGAAAGGGGRGELGSVEAARQGVRPAADGGARRAAA